MDELEKKYYQQFFVSSKKRDNRSDLDPKIVFFFSDMANNRDMVRYKVILYQASGTLSFVRSFY